MRKLTPLVAMALALVVAAPAAARASDASIVDVAVSVNAQTGEFDHLIEAATRAGLVDALDRNRQLTVFAPTDAAFEELFATLGVTGVDEISRATLQQVLLHHVVPGRRLSGSVLAARQLRTLNGDFLMPSLTEGGPAVDGATIVIADVTAGNGVIHVIDQV
ncbi:MAG TPA: fasciclin domain-containing protein, partial [Candidatus Limnocylindria bacterium]